MFSSKRRLQLRLPDALHDAGVPHFRIDEGAFSGVVPESGELDVDVSEPLPRRLYRARQSLGVTHGLGVREAEEAAALAEQLCQARRGSGKVVGARLGRGNGVLQFVGHAERHAQLAVPVCLDVGQRRVLLLLGHEGLAQVVDLALLRGQRALHRRVRLQEPNRALQLLRVVVRPLHDGVELFNGSLERRHLLQSQHAPPPALKDVARRELGAARRAVQLGLGQPVRRAAARCRAAFARRVEGFPEGQGASIGRKVRQQAPLGAVAAFKGQHLLHSESLVSQLCLALRL
mmetsp:Transcript_599/g.2208  ORF Transcript_599/g.2208 Transcript_599/m.2208 type:complete len:289 (-) Transcript_599:1107-1973(-)